MNKFFSRALSLSLAGVLALSLSACAPKEVAVVNVSAAASLTDVMGELAVLYGKKNPNTALAFTFDSSGTLQTQIEEGAPCDLFISAAQKQMKALDEQGLIAADSKVDLLENKVVLIRPNTPSDPASSFLLSSFEDVASDAVKMVAVGGDSVPVGQYTQEIYESLGLWDQISAKANFGTNVRAVLTWVENGEVDCGVVYATDAASSDQVTVVCEAPEGSCKKVIYPAALVKDAPNAAEAQKFLDFLKTEPAAAVFEAAGFKMA
ncbi:MAG: molybdate ABC transporter substrate-binding protein [Oscillospiraceae bacterium]